MIFTSEDYEELKSIGLTDEEIASLGPDDTVEKIREKREISEDQ